jgi:hypothetical protein
MNVPLVGQIYSPLAFSSRVPSMGFVLMTTMEGSREFLIFSGSKLITKYTNGDISGCDIYAPEREFKLQNPAQVEVLHF